MITSNIGEVIYKFTGESNQKVICIEDLHCNPDVQTNIAEIIKNLKGVYQNKLKFIGVEGSVGNIDTSVFSEIPKPIIKEKILNKYLEEGYLSGAEIYAVKYDKNVKIFGVESRDLYDRNSELLYQSYLFYADWQDIFASISTKIEKAINLITTEELQEFQWLQNSGLTLKEYIQKQIGFSKNKLKTLIDYPNIQIFLQALQVKNTIKKLRFQQEFKTIRKQLSNYLTEDDYLKSKDKEYTYKLIKKMKIKVPNDFLEMQKFLKFKEYQSRVDKLLLVEEIAGFEQAVSMALGKDRLQLLKLIESKNLLELMKDYFGQTASMYDVKEWREKREILYTNMRELSNILYHNKDFSKQEKLLRSIDANMDNFYHIAEKRNEVILENVFKNSQDSPVKVVIVGGYHTQGMMEFLRAKNISFEVIRPKAGQTHNKRLYYNRIHQQAQVRNNILENIEKKNGVFKHETLMVASALQDPTFNKKVVWNTLDYALKGLQKQELLKFMNDYIAKANILIEDGIFWQGKISDRAKEIYVSEGIFRIRNRQDVPLDFVVFKNRDGSEELNLTA
ncbi:MAG: hypothetical protein GY830_07150 [Bacteroidetes bacterium]|nr:hypothetical protein [Bacteroidota bacterium]